MGLFSSSKKTYVSTVTYPIGDDDPDNRVDFLKYTVLNSVLQRKPLAESISRAYLGGQGIKIRQAYKYARDKYPQGLPQSGYLYNSSPDQAAVYDVLKARHDGMDVIMLQCLVTFADYTWWAERFLAQQFGYDRTTKEFSFPPKDVEATAQVAYDIDSSGKIQILLINADGYIKTIIFKPDDLTTRVTYLHACYRTIQPFPVENTTTTRPFETGDEAGTVSVLDTVARNQELMETVTRTVTATDGVTTTLTVTKAVRVMSRPKYFLYQIGAGDYPELDEMATAVTSASPYFPSLPMRIDNKSMKQLYGAKTWEEHPLHDGMTTLLKKIGVKYDEVVEKLESNNQLNEIDFAFIQFGVALNTKTPEGKRYLFEFFDMLQGHQVNSRAEFEAWAADQEEVCLPYEKKPRDAANCTLLDSLVRVARTAATTNLCERIV